MDINLNQQDYYQRLTAVTNTTLKVNNAKNRKTLRLMYLTAEEKLTELNKESVECRRLKAVTSKYSKLDVEVAAMIDNLEKYAMLAALIN